MMRLRALPSMHRVVLDSVVSNSLDEAGSSYTAYEHVHERGYEHGGIFGRFGVFGSVHDVKE